MMDESIIKYIIARIVDNANRELSVTKGKPQNDFTDGFFLAYYEVLSILKTELIVHDQDPFEFGLGIDLEKYLLSRN